VYLQALWRSSQ